MSCKYNNCKHCGYKTECEIFKENAELKKKNLDTQDATIISDAPLMAEENETLEQGYVWDYMTQTKITTKIVTKEKGVTMFEKEAEEYAYEKWTDYPEKQEIAEQAYIAGATEETKELQEEINEWKTKFENLQKYLDTQNCYRECAEVWGNLTKAKELLNMFLRLHYRPIVDEYTLFCKVKQFIKDSEV